MGTENHSKPSQGKFRVEFLPGRGHYVVDPDGNRVSIFDSIGRIEDICAAKQRAADLANKRVNRPCLCCGTVFPSEGNHNRMCNPCRNRASNDEATPFSFGAIHGRKRA